MPNTEFKAKQIIDELRQTDLPAEVILDRQRKLQIEAELAEKEAAKKKKEAKAGILQFYLRIFCLIFSPTASPARNCYIWSYSSRRNAIYSPNS